MVRSVVTSRSMSLQVTEDLRAPAMSSIFARLSERHISKGGQPRACGFRHASFFKTRGRAPEGVSRSYEGTPGKIPGVPGHTRNHRKNPGGSRSYEGTTENPRASRSRPRATKVTTGCRHAQNRSPSSGSFLVFAKARSHGRNLGVWMREGDFRGVMAPKPVPSRNTFSRAVQPEPLRDARRRLDLESGKGTLYPQL